MANRLIDDLRVHDKAFTADRFADGVLFLFADSFESGHTSAWSDTVPKGGPKSKAQLLLLGEGRVSSITLLGLRALRFMGRFRRT